MPVEKIETVGSGALSYDSDLGVVTTRIYLCDLSDAATLWAEYVHNTEYIAEGGYFNRNRSSIRPAECFATATMVFTELPDMSTSGGSGGSHEDGDTEYNFTASSMEKPLEQNSNYRTCWNHTLLATSSTAAVPEWWSTAVDLKDADGTTYRWEKPDTPIPAGWVQLKDVYVGPTTAGNFVDFRGVESWIYPAPVLQVTKYYRSRADAEAQLLAVGNRKNPPHSGPYKSGALYWLVTLSTVNRSGKYWVCLTEYTYADRGWNTAIYAEATEG